MPSAARGQLLADVSLGLTGTRTAAFRASDMDIRTQVRAVVLVTLASSAAVGPAASAVDVTGRWGVIIQSSFVGPVRTEWDFEQTGTDLANFSATSGPHDATIDPNTGVLHVDLPDTNGDGTITDNTTGLMWDHDSRERHKLRGPRRHPVHVDGGPRCDDPGWDRVHELPRQAQ